MQCPNKICLGLTATRTLCAAVSRKIRRCVLSWKFHVWQQLVACGNSLQHIYRKIAHNQRHRLFRSGLAEWRDSCSKKVSVKKFWKSAVSKQQCLVKKSCIWHWNRCSLIQRCVRRQLAKLAIRFRSRQMHSSLRRWGDCARQMALHSSQVHEGRMRSALRKLRGAFVRWVQVVHRCRRADCTSNVMRRYLLREGMSQRTAAWRCWKSVLLQKKFHVQQSRFLEARAEKLTQDLQVQRHDELARQRQATDSLAKEAREREQAASREREKTASAVRELQRQVDAAGERVSGFVFRRRRARWLQQLWYTWRLASERAALLARAPRPFALVCGRGGGTSAEEWLSHTYRCAHLYGCMHIFACHLEIAFSAFVKHVRCVVRRRRVSSQRQEAHKQVRQSSLFSAHPPPSPFSRPFLLTSSFSLLSPSPLLSSL